MLMLQKLRLGRHCIDIKSWEIPDLSKVRRRNLSWYAENSRVRPTSGSDSAMILL